MCVTLSPASLSKTIVYAGEAHHPQRRGIHNMLYVHVLGYQNEAENKSDRPNAMILPFPSKSEMGPENVIDASASPSILKDMSKAIKPVGSSRGIAVDSLGLGYPSVKVFKSGSYTVALVQRAADVAHAIAALPPDLQPVVNREVLKVYSKWYADWPIAVCAWDGRIKAEPLFWWYEPIDAKVLFLPALDSHNGKAPNPQHTTKRDHTLIIGSAIHPFGVINPSKDLLGGFIPPQIWGTIIDWEDWNGDYTVEVEPLRQIKNYQGKHDIHARLDPKVWDIEFESYNPAGGNVRGSTTA